MDPYLEQHWEDVHTALIGYIRDALQPQLADDLTARIEEKVYIKDDGRLQYRKPVFKSSAKLNTRRRQPL